MNADTSYAPMLLCGYGLMRRGFAAETGDRVTISFVGKVDGKPFDGGTGEDIPLELGSNQFIPGFEDQLLGKKVGDDVLVHQRSIVARQLPVLCALQPVDKKRTRTDDPVGPLGQAADGSDIGQGRFSGAPSRYPYRRWRPPRAWRWPYADHPPDRCSASLPAGRWPS